jgi:hypothetical protein
MPLTESEFITAVNQTCPVCNAGRPVRFRDDTKEFVHDYDVTGGFRHSFCLATGLRKFYASQQEQKNDARAGDQSRQHGTVPGRT